MNLLLNHSFVKETYEIIESYCTSFNLTKKSNLELKLYENITYLDKNINSWERSKLCFISGKSSFSILNLFNMSIYADEELVDFKIYTQWIRGDYRNYFKDFEKYRSGKSFIFKIDKLMPFLIQFDKAIKCK